MPERTKTLARLTLQRQNVSRKDSPHALHLVVTALLGPHGPIPAEQDQLDQAKA
jgi:hypothetical protein